MGSYFFRSALRVNLGAIPLHRCVRAVDRLRQLEPCVEARNYSQLCGLSPCISSGLC